MCTFLHKQKSVDEKASLEGKVQRRIDAIEQERLKLRAENKVLVHKVEDSSRALQRSHHLQHSLKVWHSDTVVR